MSINIKLLNAILSNERILFYTALISAVYLLIAFIAIHTMITSPSGNIDIDFLAFHMGGRFYLDGDINNLYDFAAQKQYQQRFIEQYMQTPAKDSYFPFLNPPYAILLYLPFTIVEYPIGYTLWVAFNTSLFILSLILLKKEYLTKHSVSTLRFILLASSFLPVLAWILLGQATGIVFFLLTMSITSLRRGNDFPAGLFLGLLAFKPQLALCLAIPIILKLRWKAILGGLLSSGLLILAGFIMLPEQMINFWNAKAEITAQITSSSYPVWGVSSLHGMVHLLFNDFSQELVSWVSMATTIGLLATIAWYWFNTEWKPSSNIWNSTIAATFAIGLLLGLHLYTYDLTLLIIPAVVLASTMESNGNYRFDNGIILLLTIFIYFLCLAGPFFTQYQLTVTKTLFNSAHAVQFTTVAILLWSFTVLYRLSATTGKKLLS